MASVYPQGEKLTEFIFLHKRKDILPYVETLRSEADTEKKALGFLAASAYESAAHSEKILVATLKDSGEYAGHVFYGGVFPYARIFQTLVKKKFRKHGLAASMIEKLVDQLEKQSFSAISAKVATDLRVANKVYDSLGFKTVRTIKGGATTGRILNLRCRELNTPSLFKWDNTAIVLDHLALPIRSSNHSPQYLIDLNVVFDSVKKRAKAQAANILFKAGFQKIVRFAISEELINELERTSYDPNDDPVLQMVRNFWRLAIPPNQKLDDIVENLTSIIFPNRYKNNNITVQDKSDLIHLATAIENRAAGFITSEKKILAVSDYLRANYQLDVISLYELKELVDDVPVPPDINKRPYISSGLRTEILASFSLTDSVKSAIRKLEIPQCALPTEGDLSDDKIKGILVFNKSGQVVAFAWWTMLIGPIPKNRAFLSIDGKAEQIENLIDHICDYIVRDASHRDPSLVKLILGNSTPVVRAGIENCGFRPTEQIDPAGSIYQKICVGDALHYENWQKIRLKISQLTNGLTLPSKMPVITDKKNLVKLSGANNENFSVTLDNFETLLSPTLLHSPEIAGVIVPIMKSYADDLFNIKSDQLSLLDAPEAILKRERVYFCTPSANKVLRPGKLVFFYESGSQKGGRSALIAVARITQTNVVLVDDMEKNLLERGVIDQNMLNKISHCGKRTVMFFNNILPFRKLIPFARLVELGCDDGSKFVTAKSISAMQSRKLLSQGLRDARKP